VIQIECRINGRKVSPQRMASPLQAALLADAAKLVHATLGALRCPTHHRLPRVLVAGASVYGLEFTVTGCCPALVQEANRLLQDRSGGQQPALALATPRTSDAA
jgi:hypothetical protein